MASFNPVDHSIKCVVCSSCEMKDGEKLFLLECCKEGVHNSCLVRPPNGGRLVCPKCRIETCVHNHVVQKDHFTEKNMDLIDLCFLKHQVVSRIPMTQKEIQGLRVAANVPGLNALRHVSHRVFLTGLAFWMPLDNSMFCE